MAEHSSKKDPSGPKGLKALFWTWFALATGALATLLIEPTSDGFQRGLNRAIPFLGLLALSVLIALLLGVKTLFCFKHLKKRTRCLYLLPLLTVLLAALVLLDYLVNSRWTLDRLGEREAAKEGVEEIPVE